MLYKFKSKAAGDLIMLEQHGSQVLRIIGKDPAPKGILLCADMPQAISRLQEAIAKQEDMARAQQPEDDATEPAELITLRQRDLKRVVAYSSVSHMGYVLLGISALGSVGLTGAALQMFTHGTITGLLFIMVGLIYDRAHTRQIAELSGLMHRMPMIGTVLVITGFAALGLPGLSGFVAELTVFLGTLEVHPVATAAAVFGVVLGAGYILWTVQRVLTGPPNDRWAHLTDADKWWEHTAMAGMLVAIVLVGIYPRILTDVVSGGIAPIAAILGGGS